MNNQQAINLLKDLEQCLDDYCELNDEGKTAFGMAITALELFGNAEQLPSAQPEQIARDIATIIENEQDMRVIRQNAKHPNRGNGDSKMFVELKKKKYHSGGYIFCQTLFAIDDISRIVQCADDRELTNVITKDGKVHTIAENYEDVAKKICDAERRQND